MGLYTKRKRTVLLYLLFSKYFQNVLPGRHSKAGAFWKDGLSNHLGRLADQTGMLFFYRFPREGKYSDLYNAANWQVGVWKRQQVNYRITVSTMVQAAFPLFKTIMG